MTLDCIVVSGIDGGLVDPLTRDYDPARPAIATLARLRVPLVLCSSRARSEVTLVSRVFGLDAPLIAENGALLLVPDGHLRGGVPGGERDGAWHVLRLGPPLETLRRALERITAEAGVRVHRGGVRAGLPGGIGAPREHTEPFLIEDEGQAAALARAAEAQGLRLARGYGGWYVCGGADKGLAVRTLLALYEREGRRPRAIGLGSWPIDLPLLRAVHRPIVVPGPGGRVDPVLATGLPRAERAARGGPEGWNDAVLGALARRRLPRASAPARLPGAGDGTIERRVAP